MRGFREEVHPEADRSFIATLTYLKELDFGLHYHPQMELTAFTGASGVRIIGDSVEEFQDGDIQLIPPNLPHDCRFSVQNPDHGDIALHVIKFSLLDLDPVFTVPDLASVRALLHQNRGGYSIELPDRSRFFQRLNDLHRASSSASLGIFLELLGILADTGKLKPLSRVELSSRPGTHNRLSRISDHVQQHFHETIRIEEVANVAGLTPTAFSRYFSTTMGKPFSRYLNEIRISHACNRLMDSEDTVLSISEDAGFESLTNFNRRFKELRGVTPSRYRTLHRTHKNSRPGSGDHPG